MSQPSPRFARRNRIGAILLVLALMLTMALPAVAAPAAPEALPLIDHFVFSQALLTVNSSTTSASSSVSDASILGNTRDLFVQYVSGTGTVSAVVVGQPTADEFRFNSDTTTAGRAVVQWDGTTGYTATPGSFPSPGPYNFTQGGANALRVTSLFNDIATPVTFRVYSGSGNWSSLQVSLPGGQTSGSITYYWPYALFTTGSGSGANFASVTAVELFVNDGGPAGADLTIHQVEIALLDQDWGDLPLGYPTLYAANGPRHSRGTLYLGAAIDSELDGIPSAGADGDDLDQAPPDDEDGIVRTPAVLWSVANGGSIDVTVTGGPGCLWGWIDWNHDFDFFDTGDTVLENILVSGTSTQLFDIPSNPGNGSFYARFRLFPTVAGECVGSQDFTGEITNGEVEDYYWSFGPNAVTLSELQATTVSTSERLMSMLRSWLQLR